MHHDHEAANPVAPATLGLLLNRIVLEIDEAADSLSDMQTALSPLLMRAGEPSVSAKVQSLDLLEQIMRDLSVVVARIAACPAAAQSLDTAMILEKCKLANVARRLHGLQGDQVPDAIEFF